ncbi:hypothetical protein FOPG_10646 [Fusarium oxysporum f. sp. conglutinans race 2 54008]|uniref:F-box domain-containing protein n=3 Tax=Fusarium oxysporum f. sp. conglutinans TaxID=100902 RepID=A0A8H6GA77_FUSOX|nr:hypothetical protein FOPG_10646 [Fusarium oxysporum f. sp. conglutinans race 2 54008]KAF6513786.1 hypothetical protein HZS61_007111 [Fusarium oxysporum f. sp. conglutinans]
MRIAMTRLKDIPNEILTSIFTHLSDINHSSIFNVTLVNKHFNQLASPLRVRHWSDEGYYGYYDGDSPCPPISRLALELLRHPEYRLQVKTLTFSYFQSIHDRDAARVPMKPNNLQMLAWAAEEVVPTLAESTYLCARILEDNDDAIAVLVLAWATNLTSLSVTIPFFDPTPGHDEGPLVLRFAKQLALRFDSKDLKPSAPLPLAKLRELEFRHNNIESIVALKYLTPFLYLPNLKDLKTYRLGDQDYNDLEDSVQRYIKDRYCMPFPKRTSSIESITIEETTLSSDGLSDLLGSCSSLRHFYLHFSFDLDENERSWITLARSLLHHAASLEELHLCVNNCDVEWVGDSVDDAAGDSKPIDFKDCYHHLTGLKVLSVPMPHLSGHELWVYSGSREESPVRLPGSIQHLRLLDINLWSNARRLPDHEISPFLDFVLNLVRETGPQGRLRNLQTLDCSKALVDDPMREKIKEIKDLAEERGVNVLIRS